MVQVIFPLANVAFFTILRLEVTKAIGLVVEPISLIRVSVGTPELSLSISLISEPLTLVLGIVGPPLLTIGTFLAFFVYIACVISVFSDF